MQEDPFLDTSPMLGLAHEHSPGPTSALLEGLQSQLKRREGEASLLRSETRKLELQRAELTRQVATLTARADSQSTELERLAELERKYDALLQMYGEQLEANQELKLDLDDVKEMYRTQIETLLANQSLSPQ
jgi:chromosome segregation ATPase